MTVLLYGLREVALLAIFKTFLVELIGFESGGVRSVRRSGRMRRLSGMMRRERRMRSCCWGRSLGERGVMSGRRSEGGVDLLWLGLPWGGDGSSRARGVL
jgi:hypothetical protein